MKLIDFHCDTLWAMERNVPLCVDVEKLREADSLAQFFACFIYMEEYQGEDRYTKGYQYALEMLQKGKDFFASNTDVISLTHDHGELCSNYKNNKISAFLTIEEGGILEGDMQRLERLYTEGVRLITLLWNYENCIGYPNSKDRNIMESGLKSFGIDVVERMNELGMMIDVSHMSDGGFWDVLKHSKRPVVASHSNSRELCYHPRNLSDEMIRALAKQGGVIGVNTYPYFVHESGKSSMELLANHIEHIYQVGGEDVLGIGTDFDGYDQGESDFTHMGQMNQFYEVVKKRGFTARQMEKIWFKNILRVIKI